MGASPQMVDWDEDGDTDLLVGEYDGHVHYYKNIGTATNPVLTNMGHLQAGGTDIDVSQLAIPVVNDWNEDGRKDLVIGNDNANIKVYLNVGTNSNPAFSNYFLLSTNPAISQIKNAPDVGDLNGDGLKDLAFGWWQGTVVYYPNSGTNANPVFNGDYELTALGTTIDPGGWTHLELNDWDEDGDLDLVYGEWNGEVYVHLNVSDDLEATLTPYGMPIQIPASGGSFDFDGLLVNGTAHNVRASAWTVAKLPSGGESGALFQSALTLAPGNQFTRNLTQYVPAAAPAGEYEYVLRWGQYPEQAWAESSFPFTKLAGDDGSTRVGEWNCSGNPISTLEEQEVPNRFALLRNFPNPFNPTTTIRFDLPVAGRVRLEVFDVAGRAVGARHAVPLQGGGSTPALRLVNGWLEAGLHQVTFDGTGLPSGVYVYRLEAGNFEAAGKMLLVK